MKFFVPSAFEKGGDVIKFKRTKGNLGGGTLREEDTPKKAKKKKKNRKNMKSPAVGGGKGPLAPPSLDAESVEGTLKIKTGRVEKTRAKKQKQQKLKLTPSLVAAANESLSPAATSESLTSGATSSFGSDSFQAKLKEQLKGGRFRFINEKLYTMDSKKAADLFRKDKDAFAAYHEGYRHQVEKWPLNPLNRIIKMIKRLPKSLEIVDFGCGEGMLAQSVPHKVYSIDLVSCRDDIIACDMAHTSLATHSVDVAVYCLSLMGTNLKDYLLEANRVLKMNGLLYVAEIQSRFENVKEFGRSLESYGFELLKQDVGQNVFYFFQFKKVRNVGHVAKVPPLKLKPCLYRKR